MKYLDLPFRTDEDKRLFEKSTFEDLEKLGNFECIPIKNVSYFIDFIEHFNLQNLPLKDSYEYFEDCYVCEGSIEECADFLVFLDLLSSSPEESAGSLILSILYNISDQEIAIDIIKNSGKFFYNDLAKVLYFSPEYYNNFKTSI